RRSPPPTPCCLPSRRSSGLTTTLTRSSRFSPTSRPGSGGGSLRSRLHRGGRLRKVTTVLHTELKDRHRAERGNHPRDLALRVHRALSWLDRAEQSGADQDARFIFLWISFNAAYAREAQSQNPQTERE